MLCITPCVHAENQSEWQLSGSLLQFGYQEFNDAGKLLDREDGFIPGFKLGLSQTYGQWLFSGDFSFHGGDVIYTGQTNTGIPITTRTTQNIADISLRAEYWTQNDSGTAYAPYLGTGYHYWGRNILPTTTASGTPVSGLFEIYRWWIGFIGIKTEIYQSDTGRLLADARLVQTVKPTIYIDFGGQHDNSTLPLGERWGARLALPWHSKLDQSSSLLIEPYAEFFELGRSDNAPLTSNGSVVGSVYEPYSQTINYGLTLGISQKF